MLNIGNKNYMNLQEAVAWLLENNALPFQSTANYVGNTEIAMSTLINPSPAKVRVGSIIFFADSKVSTVVGVTSNSFIVSDQYNDLVDDVVYVSNVAINASGHLIVTLSNDSIIDAGLIKQISSFSINASQHLIATYNDGSTNDLGAIFNGNINIAGNLTADSIIENMIGYSYTPQTKANLSVVNKFVGAVKNGNKLTFVVFAEITRTGEVDGGNAILGTFAIPSTIGEKLYPYNLTLGSVLDTKKINAFDSFISSQELVTHMIKVNNAQIYPIVFLLNNLTLNTPYIFRYECTFLLSDSLVS